MSQAVYRIVQERIVSLLRSGVCPWKKPWKAKSGQFTQKRFAHNAVSGREYRGINFLLLNSTKFQDKGWLTFNQAKAFGGSVKRGEKGSPCFFWKILEVEEEKDGVKRQKKIPFLRYFTVFNLEQTENVRIPKHKGSENPVETKTLSAQEVIASYKDGPTVRLSNSDAAFYCPAGDTIEMPAPELFSSPDAYHRVVFHELVHSTGHEKRLNRGISTVFASEAYSKEELIAEMGAAFVCAETGHDSDDGQEQSAAYCQSWADTIGKPENIKMVVCACSAAQKAADYILGRKSELEESEAN